MIQQGANYLTMFSLCSLFVKVFSEYPPTYHCNVSKKRTKFFTSLLFLKQPQRILINARVIIFFCCFKSNCLQDFDGTNCGTVSEEQFLKALSLRGMYNLISRKEFDMICKCFSFERGLRDEVDYRAFIKALDILHATDKYNPFQEYALLVYFYVK